MASRYGSLFALLSTSVQAETVFSYTLDSGIAFIETGRMYDEGKTEQSIGKAVSHRRGGVRARLQVPALRSSRSFDSPDHPK